MPYSAPAFGLLSTGYVPKLTSDFLLDFTTSVRGTTDPTFDVSPSEPMGQIFGIMASAMADRDALIQTVYNGINPNAAEGALLYGTGAITGTKPIGAAAGTCIVNCVLGVNATINAGLVANVAGQPANTWTLIGACDAKGNVTGVLKSTTAGTYLALFESTQTGPQVAAAGTLTVVPSLPAGLTSISNPADAVLGTVAETDAQFRVRRDLELAAGGSESLDAIRASALEVAGVQSVNVYDNKGDSTDAQGRPPHSVEVVIFDGITPAANNDAIAQALWDEQIGGIPYYSATGDFGTAVDAAGNAQVVAFSRVVVTPIYIAITTVGATSASAVQASVVATAGALVPGSTVYRLQLEASPLPDGPNPVAGCVDVTSFTLGIAPTPTGTANIAMSVRQMPYIETANVTVTLT